MKGAESGSKGLRCSLMVGVWGWEYTTYESPHTSGSAGIYECVCVSECVFSQAKRMHETGMENRDDNRKSG